MQRMGMWSRNYLTVQCGLPDLLEWSDILSSLIFNNLFLQGTYLVTFNAWSCWLIESINIKSSDKMIGWWHFSRGNNIQQRCYCFCSIRRILSLVNYIYASCSFKDHASILYFIDAHILHYKHVKIVNEDYSVDIKASQWDFPSVLVYMCAVDLI